MVSGLRVLKICWKSFVATIVTISCVTATDVYGHVVSAPPIVILSPTDIYCFIVLLLDG